MEFNTAKNQHPNNNGPYLMILVVSAIHSFQAEYHWNIALIPDLLQIKHYSKHMLAVPPGRAEKSLNNAGTEAFNTQNYHSLLPYHHFGTMTFQAPLYSAVSISFCNNFLRNKLEYR